MSDPAVLDPSNVNPSQVATPPVASVAPPAAQPSAVEQAAAAAAAAAGNAPAPVEAIVYPPTGDVGLDIALEFIGGLGLREEHPAIKRAAEGDFALLEEVLKEMGTKAKGFERYVALAKEAVVKRDTTAAAKDQAVITAVHAVAGSAEEWKAIKEWASANADPKEREEMNAMFMGGPVSARAAAVLLKAEYDKRAPKKPASAVKPDAGKTSVSADKGPINRRQFVTEIQALRKVHGNDYNKTPAYKALALRVAR